MTCIKTGAQVYMQKYCKYAICDIHEFQGEFYVLRVNPSWKDTPIRPDLHATIKDVVQDWSGSPATYVVLGEHFEYYGYDEAPIAP